MRMFNNCRFGLLTVAFVAALTMSTFGVVASADEPVASVADSNKEAEEFFNKMSPEQFSDPVALDDFIRRFPDSDQARIVFAYRYSLLEQMLITENDDKNNIIKAFNEFIAKYPDKLQAQVAIQKVFELYRYQDRVTGYYDFIKNHPDTQQAIVAMMRIQELMFEYVCKLDKVEEYDAYISAFPDAPQVRKALKNALKLAKDEEQKIFEKFLNTEPKPTDAQIEKFINKKITTWELEVSDFQTQYPNIDISPDASNDEKIEVRNKLYIIYREANVLQTTYAEYGGIGRIQSTRNSLNITARVDRINQTLKTNQKELLAKLDEETDRICKGLEQLHKDNQQIIDTLKSGFALLHQDMVDIKDQLKDIKRTLDNMDRHLEQINRSIVEGFKETNAKLEKINNTVKVGFEVQAQLQREQLAELRIQSSRLMDLTLVGANGYNKSGSLWDSPYAKDQSSKMSSRFTAIRNSGNSSSIAKFVGGLAASGATFIPCVGPFIAPAVGKFTEHVVDNAVIPNAQQLFSDITNPNDRRSLKEKVSDTVKKAGADTLNSVVQAAPVIWQEEKQNLLTAAQKLADKAGIPEGLSNDVLEVVDSDSLDEMAGKLAEKCGVPKEALTFAAQYIY